MLDLIASLKPGEKASFRLRRDREILAQPAGSAEVADVLPEGERTH